jgi:hypothetical protein
MTKRLNLNRLREIDVKIADLAAYDAVFGTGRFHSSILGYLQAQGLA